MHDDLDRPIAYMPRIAEYYRALGFAEPYRYAHFEDVPFTAITTSVSQLRIALVTTAAPFRPELGDQGPGAPYNAAAKFFTVYALPVEPAPDLRISHITYDRTHTSAEDPGTWLPLEALKEAAHEGRIGGLTDRVYGMPTNRSQRTSIETDAPALIERIREDGGEAAILVANCPICHQSISLAARHLEAGGIPTVVMGCAKDIVEHAGVPRYLFSDFPLGNAAGRPSDPASQRETLTMALGLLAEATAPRTTHSSPLIWSGDPAWKLDFSNASHLTESQIAATRRAFDERETIARRLREDATGTSD